MSAITEREHLARERLIESHLPLVRSVARNYAGRGEALDDLVQVGAIGLIKASDRFDESRGVAFATFAARTIDGEIRRHLRDRASSLRIPRDLQRASGELRRQRNELTAALGHSPTVAELAAALETDRHHVERALQAELAREAVPLSPGSDAAASNEASDQQGASEDRLSLASSLRALDDRARAIIFLRFHADMTEREIARELGLSQAHVSRLLQGALTELRAELAAPDEGATPSDINDAVVSESGTSTRMFERLRESAAGPTDPHPPGAKLGGVLASHENRTLAHYLELPYTVAVKSDRDGERSCWSATVEELPGCSARGQSPDEAVELLRPAMEAWLAEALAERREIPVPTERSVKRRTPSGHSGRFLVRMPGGLHEQLARAAEREQLSLNRFVTKVLAESLKPGTDTQPDRAERSSDEALAPADHPKSEPTRAFRVALATNAALVVVAGLAAITLLVLAVQSGF